MKVLSLFDGMSCGYLALQRAGIEINRYVAYEIDKYAVETSSFNFPDIEHNGDVFNADFNDYKDFDFLIGGSPCTYWSIAQTKNRETTASGLGWELFSQYVRALNEAKPKYFLYENNKSMSNAIRESISNTFGFEPICINSALVSAQNRQRLYWCGIRQKNGSYKKADIMQPEDRGILLKDILETAGYPAGVRPDGKSHVLTASYDGAVIWKTLERYQRTMAADPICINSKSGRNGTEGLQPSLQDRIYSIEGKMTAVTTSFLPNIAEPLREKEIYTNTPIYKVKDGFITVKNKNYPIKLIDGFYVIRKLTVTECMRLQTVPDYYKWPVSKTQAYKMLGNGWTIEVITHLLKSILENKKE